MNNSHTGTYHLADNPKYFEIQRNNNFEFIVTDLDNIRRAGALGTESNANIKNAQELLRLSVSKAAVPHFTQEVVTIKRGNSTMKYAGVPDFKAGSFEFHDYVGADTKAILMAWQNLSYNVDTEIVGSMANPDTQYKKNCYLVEYTPDKQMVRSWILYGCWISALDEGQYSGEDGGKHAITATIEYDHAKIDTSELV